MIYGKIETPLGEMLACVSDEGLYLLEFNDRKKYDRQINSLKKYFNSEITKGNHPLLAEVQTQINEYFQGKRKEFTILLKFSGTEFQKNVWKELLKIPYGKTASYSDIAKKIKNPKAVRAVANANAANKIAIIIPCHRVIGSDGSLTGYAAGLDKKKFLLKIENNT
ncbi:MAG: methylated-DNA--[protein]-cysteine S-methyltransferase [Chlorobi bacterium]|nr:methylated-DNA--[protein]-cysteine S-methyltransferase [Chlorobiota bacterium]